MLDWPIEGLEPLTFVLAVGAIAEFKVLGGQKIIPITHDIEIAFTYAQNWPLGAALAFVMMTVLLAIYFAAMQALRWVTRW